MHLSSKENKEHVLALLDEAYSCRTNNLNESTRLAQQALTISRSLNDNALIGKSLNELALFAMIKGEYTASADMSAEAISYFEQLNDEVGVANAKYNIAGIYYKSDNFHLGLIYLIDCLGTYRKFNDYHNQSRVEKSIATIYEYFGDQKKAVQSYENAIEAAKKTGDINLESNAYNPLSGIYLKLGKVDEAMEIIERSIKMKSKTGDVRGMAFSVYARAKVYLKTKQYKKAETDLKDAIRIHKQMGERLGLGMAYRKLCTLYVETGRLTMAKKLLNTTIKFSNEYSMVIITFKCSYVFYQIYKLENKPEKALEYLELYMRQKDAVINAQTLKVIENYELITKMELLENEAAVQRERAEIIEKKNRAEQAAAVKQEFLSTMSHEIRTPLNAVITIASLLSTKVDKEEQLLIDSLKFASNNLLLIINDILDFTKLEAGKARIEARACNLRELLENIKNTYVALASEKGLRLNLIIDEHIAEFYEVDETKVSQILGNLLTNAIKFTETGQVDVVVDKMQGNELHDTLHFKISDTGTGIDERFLEDIFDSFSQPKSITTRKQGGSGLGLAIVKKLVALHGSNVQVKSIIGEGSVFYFDIELKKCDSPVKNISKYTNQLNGKTILLAEDNLINAMLISKVLSNWEISTEHVKNGLEAVERSKLKHFDFILMDIHMPEMDGFEVTKHIRDECESNSKTPIFAITADITAEYMDEHTPYFNGFLRKPIEIDKLYEALVNASVTSPQIAAGTNTPQKVLR